LGTLVSATIGVTSAWLGGVIASADYGTAWWTWWVGDAMGDLVVAPSLLIWRTGLGINRQGVRWIEPGGFVIALVVVAMLVFRSGWFLPSGQYPGAYVVFPFVIWAAVRYGQPGLHGKRRRNGLECVRPVSAAVRCRKHGRGMSHDPLWFKNLEANRRVEIELGNMKLACTARRATADEKAALWPILLAMYPPYATCQARTHAASRSCCSAPQCDRPKPLYDSE
jgi:deazaflavin-dependent oxidoreductase (nitroreductase family)